MNARWKMFSFELSAIDIVLVIAVIILLILYVKKFSVGFPEEKDFRKKVSKKSSQKLKQTSPDSKINYAKCPRGYGNIRKIGPDNSVSEKCLGCYKIMECYSWISGMWNMHHQINENNKSKVMINNKILDV